MKMPPNFAGSAAGDSIPASPWQPPRLILLLKVCLRPKPPQRNLDRSCIHLFWELPSPNPNRNRKNQEGKAAAAASLKVLREKVCALRCWAVEMIWTRKTNLSLALPKAHCGHQCLAAAATEAAPAEDPKPRSLTGATSSLKTQDQPPDWNQENTQAKDCAPPCWAAQTLTLRKVLMIREFKPKPVVR